MPIFIRRAYVRQDMAKSTRAKRSTRKMVKVDDVQRTLELRSQTTSNPQIVIQVPDMLMRSNRRQYQQCRAYDVQLDIGSVAVNTEQVYEIYTLSNAWWVKKSIEYAKAVWLHTTKEERALLGDRAGKWNDFIIQADVGTTTLYSDLYQYSLDADGGDMTAVHVSSDETLYEDQSGASGVEGDQDIQAELEVGFSLQASDVSGGIRSYNIFDQYLLTRQHVSPADTRDAPYKDLMDVDQIAMDNIKKDGDNAPFDLNAFPSPWVLADTIGHDQQRPNIRGTSKMITAPLGIIVLKKLTNAGANDNFASTEKILVHCKKGAYKGVHAPAYKATKLTFTSSAVHKFTQ